MATSDRTELTVRLTPRAAEALALWVERSGASPDDVVSDALVRADVERSDDGARRVSASGSGDAEVRWAAVLKQLLERDGS